MSKSGDLGWLRSALFAQLQEPARPLALEADHPGRAGLEWLQVPLRVGPTPSLQSQPLELDLEELQSQGLLPEVVYSCLVQTWWHPQQDRYLARTRSEILACYDASQLDRPGWPLELEDLEKINAYRLQELTPHELLTAAAPFLGSLEDDAPAALEAWVLLHLPQFRRLQDVAACLSPFHKGPGRGLSEAECQRLLQAPSAPEWLPLPPDCDWSLARQILGDDRLRRRMT